MILVLDQIVPVGEKEILLTEEVIEGVTALRNGEKDSHAEIDNQLGSLNKVAGMSDEEVDEKEDTVDVDTIMFCTLMRKANCLCTFCS